MSKLILQKLAENAEKGIRILCGLCVKNSDFRCN